MAGTNDFLSWAIGPGANVMSQASYASNPAQTVGVSVGLADPTLANKTWRQSSFITAAIAQFVANNQTGNVQDNGNLGAFIAQFEAGLIGYLTSTTVGALRLRLTANTTLYVDGTSGVDQPGQGLAPTTGAWKSFQYAYYFIQTYYDLAGYTLTLSMIGAVGPCFMNGPLVGLAGRDAFVIQASGATTVIGTGSLTGVLAADGAQCKIVGTNITITAGASGSGVEATGAGAEIEIGNALSIGACGLNSITTAFGGKVLVTGTTMTVSGNGQAWLSANDQSLIWFQGCTVTFSGTPSYSAATVGVARGSVVDVSGVTFVGSVTGIRAVSSDTSILWTNGQNATFIPGNASIVTTFYIAAHTPGQPGDPVVLGNGVGFNYQ